MITPKEKAIELVDKFARIDGYQDSIDLSKCDYEKQCALIAVDAIISYCCADDVLFLHKVKEEIEKL